MNSKPNFFFPQLIVYMSLAAGTSRIRTGPITLHTQTAMHIAHMMTQVCATRHIIFLDCFQKNFLQKFSLGFLIYFCLEQTSY